MKYWVFVWGMLGLNNLAFEVISKNLFLNWIYFDKVTSNLYFPIGISFGSPEITFSSIFFICFLIAGIMYFLPKFPASWRIFAINPPKNPSKLNLNLKLIFGSPTNWTSGTRTPLSYFEVTFKLALNLKFLKVTTKLFLHLNIIL